MEKKTGQTATLIVLIAVPVILIAGIWLFARYLRPPDIRVPDVQFLATAVLEATFVSELPEAVPESELQFDYPLLQPGDYADPRIIWRDFHVIPDGYRAVDQTKRRVITMNRDLDVVAVLDRSANIPDGIWQDIDVVCVDKSADIYLLDRTKKLVQVLDSGGNYLRRHTSLGWDFFGSELALTDIQLDQFDRLWIVGGDRIYVLDRYGNLDRIFERRGAPFSRARQPWSGRAPSEQTPVGYTIMASTGTGIGARDPTLPMSLDVGEFNSFTLGGGIGNQLFYIGQNGNSEIVICDYSGVEHGTIDLASLAHSDRRQFIAGPDGYLYLVDPETETLFVLDPLGDLVTTIRVEDLPDEGWTPSLRPGIAHACPFAPVTCYVDFDGRLVVYDTRNGKITLYELRER